MARSQSHPVVAYQLRSDVKSSPTMITRKWIQTHCDHMLRKNRKREKVRLRFDHVSL